MNPLSGPSGKTISTKRPNALIPPSISSMKGVAQEKTAWNIRNIANAKITKPATGCRKILSKASSIEEVLLGITTLAEINLLVSS